MIPSRWTIRPSAGSLVVPHKNCHPPSSWSWEIIMMGAPARTGAVVMTPRCGSSSNFTGLTWVPSSGCSCDIGVDHYRLCRTLPLPGRLPSACSPCQRTRASCAVSIAFVVAVSVSILPPCGKHPTAGPTDHPTAGSTDSSQANVASLLLQRAASQSDSRRLQDRSNLVQEASPGGRRRQPHYDLDDSFTV